MDGTKVSRPYFTSIRVEGIASGVRPAYFMQNDLMVKDDITGYGACRRTVLV